MAVRTPRPGWLAPLGRPVHPPVRSKSRPTAGVEDPHWSATLSAQAEQSGREATRMGTPTPEEVRTVFAFLLLAAAVLSTNLSAAVANAATLL